MYEQFFLTFVTKGELADFNSFKLNVDNPFNIPAIDIISFICYSYLCKKAFERLILSFFNVVIHIRKPLNYRCHMGTVWIIPVMGLHALYVVSLIAFTGAVRHVEFRFHELKDLWRGILVSAASIGLFLSIFFFWLLPGMLPLSYFMCSGR